jgi:hypothetical protein
MPDPIYALCLYLAVDPTVGLGLPVAPDTTVNGTDGYAIYPIELPVTMDVNMPAKAVVIKPHGGPGAGLGASAHSYDPAPLQLNYSRIQVQCFGETPHLAYVVDWAVYMSLKNLERSVLGDTYIHNCIRATGPIPARDPELQWPYSTSVWLVKASDLNP